MKTLLTSTPKNTLMTLSLMGIMTLSLLAFNPIYGQSKPATLNQVVQKQHSVKGIVSDESAALEGVNVIQEGSRNGTVTNEKGEFIFPTQLKTGDVLLFSYLGYVTQKIVIKDDTSFISLKLTADLIEMIGDLDSAKPYKSKRKHQ